MVLFDECTKNVLKEQKENMSWKKYVENMKDLIVESTRNMVWVAMALLPMGTERASFHRNTWLFKKR